MRWLILILLLLPCAFAATIQGTVYDFTLEPVANTVLEINSSPRQILVSKDGQYLFEVPVGNYRISAVKAESVISEDISVSQDGVFNIDLILMPDLSVEEALLDYSEVEAPEVFIPDDVRSYVWLYIIVGVVLAILLIYFLYKKKKKPQIDPQLKIILDFVSKQGGRTTQKDIYKNVPWSEAKVSLMLDELESQSLIRRVKKGRTNLVFRK